jgi:hypothetical protein
MGFFSWKTQDTNRSISNVDSVRGSFFVVMHDNNGNKWTENEYDGYGEFGGKDYYELLAEMNGLSTRYEGIKLAFSDEPCLYPNLTERVNWNWINEEPEHCDAQGFFYEDDNDEYTDKYENDFEQW